MTTTETRGYTPPEGLVFTPAMRAADDAYRDELRQADLEHVTAEWEREARERIHGRRPWWLEHGRTA